MASSDFLKNNRTLVIIVVIAIVILLIYYFFFSGNSNTIVVRPKVTVTRDSKFDSCMEPEIQQQIADKITEKINELQCDCSGSENDETVSNTTVAANIREAFKKV